MNDSEAQKLSIAVYRMARKYETENITISVQTSNSEVGMSGELIWTAEELIDSYVTESENSSG